MSEPTTRRVSFEHQRDVPSAGLTIGDAEERVEVPARKRRVAVALDDERHPEHVHLPCPATSNQ
ncbi:MAG TPA: hypothetical protein VFJ85_04720 [Acidimicrobiales bacterium]|nr:hypothetical protein [Acidimicrobiales bacterium]